MTDRVSTWRRVRINLDLTQSGPPAWAVFVEDTVKGIPRSSVHLHGSGPTLPPLREPSDLPTVLRALADRLERSHR